MKKMRLCAAALALLSAMAVTVHAKEEIPAEITVDGMRTLEVTSCLSDPRVNVGVLFDRNAATGGKISDSFTVYTAHRVRDYLDALAVQMNDGDEIPENTIVSVAVYGTNDEMTLGWTQLDVADGAAAENGFYVFDVENDKTKYAFYRLDFSVVTGDGFELTEICMLQEDRSGPDYRYDLGDSIEPGEIPKLVPILDPPERTVPKFSLIPWAISRKP